MDNYKVEQAKKLFGAIQGMFWNKERNAEYGHYERLEDCDKVIDNLYKKIEELGLTNEEKIYANNNADMDVAEDWYGRY